LLKGLECDMYLEDSMLYIRDLDDVEGTTSCSIKYLDNLDKRIEAGTIPKYLQKTLQDMNAKGSGGGHEK